jgi:predicted nucleic acid-binding protein
MKKLRIYVDTSVFGGCFDVEFATWSNALMDDFRAGRFRLVVSDVTAAEVALAPKLIRDLFLEFLVAGESLSVTTDALDLLSVYERRGVLGPRFRNDMLHIAVATVAEVDVLVSWNFKHIVRLDKIQLFNGTNQEFGYRPVGIYSPREVATYGRED